MVKILTVLFVVCVAWQFVTTTCGARGLLTLGNCTFKQYTIKMRSCTTEFVVNMTSDPHGPCRPKFSALKDCVVEKLKRCVPSLSGKETIKHVVEQNFKEKTYCDNAGIEYSTYYPKVSPVPCAQAYYDDVAGCYNRTLRLWRTNRADERLCSEYARAKWCDQQLLAAHCIVYRVYSGARMWIDLHYDNYNPFCMPHPSVRQQTSTTYTQATTKKAKSAAWSMFYQGSFAKVLVSYWTIAIWLWIPGIHTLML